MIPKVKYSSANPRKYFGELFFIFNWDPAQWQVLSQERVKVFIMNETSPVPVIYRPNAAPDSPDRVVCSVLRDNSDNCVHTRVTSLNLA